MPVPDDGLDALRARMLDERVVSLFGRLDDAAVTRVAAELWTLDALGDEPVSLLVSIAGGTVDAAAAMLDVLDVVGVELRVTCVGGISGPAIAVLAGAARRETAPSARFVLRDEPVSLAGSYRELERAARDHHTRRNELFSRLAAATRGRRSLGDILADFERGVSLGAEEALGYGLVDAVTPVRRQIVALPRPASPLGFHRDDRRR